MKLLESLIPVFVKMTGIVNDDFFQDSPNGRMEASMDEVNGGMDFTAPPTAGRHPLKGRSTEFFRQSLSKTSSIAEERPVQEPLIRCNNRQTAGTTSQKPLSGAIE